MKKELVWFQQDFGSFQDNDTVRYNVMYSQDGRPSYGIDYSTTNTQLQIVSTARGKTTWDETDIVQLHLTAQAEVITVRPAPTVVEIIPPQIPSTDS